MNGARSPRLKLRCLILFASIGCAHGAAAEDIVFLESQDNPGSELKVAGEVLDYTGRAIRIRQTTGVERSYAGSRVIRIERPRTDVELQADAAFEAGDLRRAVPLYRKALGAEGRTWARRAILARLVWAHRGLGEIETACDTFLLIYDSDATTPYLDCMPLAWSPGERVARLKADAWLADRGRPAAVLMGASHLMSSDARESALAALRDLRGESDPRIAALATAQTWRAEVFRAESEQIESWSQRIDAMPESIRGGPYYLLGRSWARSKDWEQAALAFLRLPVLYPQDSGLAAQSLLEAGDALAKLGRPAQAATCYREIKDRFAASVVRAEAENRLSGLNQNSRP